MHKNKERMERSKMSCCTTLHVSWKMELWRLEVHMPRGILCTGHAQRAFLHLDRLYLVTDVP